MEQSGGRPPNIRACTCYHLMFFHLDKETGRHSLEAQVVTPMSRSMTLEVSKDAFTAAWQQSESPSKSTQKKKAKKKKKTKTNDRRGVDWVEERAGKMKEQKPPQTHRIPSSPPSSPARHKRPAYIHGDRPNTLDTRSPLPDMYAERKARSEAKKKAAAIGGVHGEPAGRAGQGETALVEDREGKGEQRTADETAGSTAGTPRLNGKRGLLKPPPGSPKPPPPPPTPSKKSTLLKPPPGSPRPPPPPRTTPSSSSKDEAPPTTRNGTATSATTRTTAQCGADGGADGVTRIEKANVGSKFTASQEPSKLTPTQQYLKHFLERAGVEGDYAEDLEEALAMSATAAEETGETGETEETGTTGESEREKEEGKGNDEERSPTPATPELRDVITITIATGEAELGVKVSPFGGIVTKVKDHPFLQIGDKLVQVGETAVPVDVTSGVAAHMIMTAIYPLELRFRRGTSGEAATTGEGEKGASAARLLDHSNGNESHAKRGEGFEPPVDHPHEDPHQRQQPDNPHGLQGGPLMKLPAWVLPWIFGETEEGLRDMVRFVRYLHDHVDQLASEDGSEEEEAEEAEEGSAVGGDAKGGARGATG